MTKENSGSVQRRDLLRGAAAALGAALLAKPAGVLAAPHAATADDAIALWRPEYLRFVERIAEEAKPRFLSGELHGFNDADGDVFEAERKDRAKEGRYGEKDKYLPPEWAFERELRAKYIQGFPHAYLILACSPSEAIISGDIPLGDVESAASLALVYDIFRIARVRGWYKVTPGEEPTNEALGIAGVLS